jgi:CTP synthase (UTP-ammonia lyase)
MKGALNAIQFARENNYPFIGTCGGFQHTVIEYAQNKLGYKEIQDKKFDLYTSNIFITALSCSLIGETRQIFINKNSKISKIYSKTEIEERFNSNPHKLILEFLTCAKAFRFLKIERSL